MKRPIPLPLIALLGFTPILAQAFTTSFEAGEGYTAGELVGQPSSGTTWGGTSGIATVVTSGGNPNGHVSLVGVSSDLSPVNFAPTDLDLGGATFPQSINFSFDIRNDSFDGGGDDLLGRIVVLRDAAAPNRSRSLRLSLNVNGTVEVVSDTFVGGSLNVMAFGDATSFSNFSGTLNFADQTSTLSINGAAVNGGSPFNFNVQSGTGSDAYGFFEANVAGVGNTYSLDNLSLTAVPEPGTAGIFLGGLAALLAFRRLRSRKTAA